MNKTQQDLPGICWDQTKQERYLALSLELERKLWGDEYIAKYEEEHRQAFQKVVEKGKFCRVDTEKALTDPLWISFFQSLS